MQDKSDRTKLFLDKFDQFCVRNGLKVKEACERVGISRSLFYDLRDGKREVTLKMEERLNRAETPIFNEENTQTLVEAVQAALRYEKERKDMTKEKSADDILLEIRDLLNSYFKNKK